MHKSFKENQMRGIIFYQIMESHKVTLSSKYSEFWFDWWVSRCLVNSMPAFGYRNNQVYQQV